MPCGKRPLVKKWDKPKPVRAVKPSRYEQNEASVKIHWKKAIRDLELSYKDDQFWETQRNTVQELVGPTIFSRLAKIFKLPPDSAEYYPPSESCSIQGSEMFYTVGSEDHIVEPGAKYSMSDYEPSEEELSHEEEELEDWTETTEDNATIDRTASRVRSMIKSKSFVSKTFSSKYAMSKMSKVSRTKSINQSFIGRKSFSSRSKRFSQVPMSIDSPALTGDDLIVHGSHFKPSRKISLPMSLINPHFEMLYCNESETDMIKWNSKYKHKEFEVSASDEFSKKAEIMAKQISKNFFDWWVSLGNVEFKSEIKRPEDIEDLFQVLFDEHASRGLVLDPRILPCVLPSIAEYVGVPKASCPSVLKRQIAYDIDAETSPAHKEAFGTCLPQKMKHIPPNNDTEKLWHSLVIPEDLKSMSAVWAEIAHLTSTKAFHEWLLKRPNQPMAKFLRSLGAPGDTKQAFIVPSDFVIAKDKSTSASDTSSSQELALPISEFALELKEVLSKLMND